MPDHSLFRLRILPWCIALAMSGSYSSVWAEDDIQFDSRFLELKGDTKIDLKRFSSQGYVEPGKYNLQVQLNKQPLAEEYDIYWYAGEDDASKSYACLTPELVAQFGLKEDVAKNLQWSHDAKCLKSGQLEGVEIKADLSQSALVISLPQAYLEYTYPDWDPPSRWDDGISGIVADYSINAQTRHEENGGDDSNEISGNGTVGVNLGPWRMRADWQTNYQHTRSNDDDEFSGDETQKKWEWSRYYAWRALPSLKAKLALGEDYLRSDKSGDTMSRVNFFLVLKLPGGSLTAGRYMAAHWEMKTISLRRLASVAICLHSARSRLMLLTRTPNWIKTPLMAKVRWTVTPSV